MSIKWIKYLLYEREAVIEKPNIKDYKLNELNSKLAHEFPTIVTICC